jgi:hypothetical protein
MFRFNVHSLNPQVHDDRRKYKQGIGGSAKHDHQWKKRWNDT